MQTFSKSWGVKSCGGNKSREHAELQHRLSPAVVWTDIDLMSCLGCVSLWFRSVGDGVSLCAGEGLAKMDRLLRWEDRERVIG